MVFAHAKLFGKRAFGLFFFTYALFLTANTTPSKIIIHRKILIQHPSFQKNPPSLRPCHFPRFPIPTLKPPGRHAQISPSTTSAASTIGINTCTPFACAIAPTAKGSVVAPVAPNAAANPIDDTCRSLGSSFVAATTAAGKKGPRKKPARVTAAIEAGMEGTSQRTRCEIRARMV